MSEERISIARRLLFSEQGDWLARYDPTDEEFLPPRMHMAFLRLGIVSHLESPEGGYMLTDMGKALAADLREMMADAA